MQTSWLTLDLRQLPKKLFLFTLISYPLFAFLVVKSVDMEVTKAFGIVCVSFLLYRCFEIYKTESNLKVPFYVILYGLFTAYTLFCYMFITDYFITRGNKYFYSDPIWLTFIGLILVENIEFSYRSIQRAKQVLVITLILASVVSIIQIFKPLFLVDDRLFVQGMSIERMQEYYQSNPNALSKGESGYVDRFFEGYRLSIFSYISGISVGIDAIAIFSILVAWRPINSIKRGSYSLFAAIISFLSSSRWVILGFVIVASQIFWSSKNKLTNFLYFVVIGVAMLFTMGLGAYFVGFDIQQYINERLLSNSALTRFLAFEVFFEVFPDNPIFGTGGADTEKMVRLLGGKSSQIHVGFLKLFYYYGLVGGTLYLSFMFAFLARLRKMAKRSGYWGGFFAILTFFVANLTLFEPSLFYYGPLLAIILSNYFYKNNENSAITTINNNS